MEEKPLRPFLVVTKMTPLAAWLPYNAAAEAPFRMLMFSMSSGLRLEMASPASRVSNNVLPCDPLALFIGIPSIT